MYICSSYTADCLRSKKKHKVLVYLITNPQEILKRDNNCILNVLDNNNLGSSVGLYFYRFKHLKNDCGFSKIGEVSSENGIENRFKRGWHGTSLYGDTYLNKELHNDISQISFENPMYFIFYEYDLLDSFPKIDELHAFSEHKKIFGRLTNNRERINSNFKIGSNLVWHKQIFDEVLNLKLPDGKPYPF